MKFATFLQAGSLAVLLVTCATLNAQEYSTAPKPEFTAYSVNLSLALDELDRDFGDEDAAGDKWGASPSLFSKIDNVRVTKDGYEFNLTGKRASATSKLKKILAAEGWTVVGESLAARTFTLDLARNGELLSAVIIENADRRTSRVSALHFIAKISREKSTPVKSKLVSFGETR